MDELSLGRADKLLTEYLQTKDAREESQLLESLASELRPVVRRVLAARAGGANWSDEGLEDTYQDCMVSIVGKILRIKHMPGETPIRSLQSYAAAAARNAFNGRLRQLQKERRHDGLEMDEFHQESSLEAFSETTTEQISREDLLQSAWSTITRLPLPQRIALLFALPPEAFLAYRLLVGTAALCSCLELSREEIDALTGHLPMADAEIAASMECSRQHVINLRQAARQRIARSLMGE